MKTRMNCRKFRRLWPQMVQAETEQVPSQKWEDHRASCAACAEYDRQMRKALQTVTPKRLPVLPEGFDERLHARLQRRRMPKRPSSKRLLWQVSFAAAAVAVGLFVGIGLGGLSPAHAAEQLFCKGRKMTDKTGTMLMEMQVRTLPQENFMYIDPEADFVPHTVQVQYGTPWMWRLEKPGRIACCDGVRQYAWMPRIKSGYMYDLYSNVMEDFALLIDPRLLLACEEQLAAERNAATQYIHQVEGEQERIMVIAPAAGVEDPLHGRLGTCLDERDNRREYMFDRRTGRLTGFRVLVMNEGKEVPVVETTRIEYDVPLDEAALTARPASDAIAWIDLCRIDYGGGLTNMTADEAVRRVVAAFGEWDRKVLDKAMAYYPLMLLKPKWNGAELVEVGTPFRSGTYPGVFVPCKIRLRDGTMWDFRLALRNDNPEKAWIVDGGI